MIENFVQIKKSAIEELSDEGRNEIFFSVVTKGLQVALAPTSSWGNSWVAHTLKEVVESIYHKKSFLETISSDSLTTQQKIYHIL